MKRSETLKVVKAACIAGAQLMEAWPTMPRKDPEYCNVALTFMGNEPDSMDIVEFQVPWKTLEGGLTLEQLIYEIFSICWEPPADSKTLTPDVPSHRTIN